MNDYTALLHRVVRAFATTDGATLENALSCINSGEYLRQRMCHDDARVCLDRAAQHLWGGYPPEGIKVDDNWHYTVIFP